MYLRHLLAKHLFLKPDPMMFDAGCMGMISVLRRSALALPAFLISGREEQGRIVGWARGSNMAAMSSDSEEVAHSQSLHLKFVFGLVVSASSHRALSPSSFRGVC